jgi:hypothetical protein
MAYQICDDLMNGESDRQAVCTPRMISERFMAGKASVLPSLDRSSEYRKRESCLGIYAVSGIIPRRPRQQGFTLVPIVVGKRQIPCPATTQTLFPQSAKIT